MNINQVPKDVRESGEKVGSLYPQLVEFLKKEEGKEVDLLIRSEGNQSYYQGRVQAIREIISIFAS